MKYYISFFLIVLSILGCTQRRIEDFFNIDILAEPTGRITYLSEIAKDVKYIPLQTSEDCLLRYIHDIKLRKQKFYINTLTEIFCFDSCGKYLYKLKDIGRGPNEFTEIYDYDLSSENDLLLILTRNKLIIYHEEINGFRISSVINLKNQPSYADFVPCQDKILLSYSSTLGIEPFQNILINLNGSILYTRKNYYMFENRSNMMFAAKFDNLIFSNENTIHFKSMFSDTVFSFNSGNNKTETYCILNSRGNHINPEVISSDPQNKISEYVALFNVLNAPNFIIYKYSYKKTSHIELYNKESKVKLAIENQIFLKDDILDGVNFEPKYSSDGKLLSWIDAMSLKKHMTSEGYNTSKESNNYAKYLFKKTVDSINEIDNPIIIVVTPL